jgi:Arc/MetJ-type ribon-helix-helix transcriptional regulator
MKTQRITVRLPVHQIRTIDTFQKLGEYSSRSEAIRRAVGILIDENTERILQKAEKLKQVAQLEALTDSIKDLTEK